MLRQHLSNASWRRLKSYLTRLESFLSEHEGSSMRFGVFWMRLGACKNSDFVSYILNKTSFQSICFDGTLRMDLGCVWRRILKRPEAFLSHHEGSRRRFGASWMQPGAWKNNDVVLYVVKKQVFNPYASTASFECILEAFEVKFVPSWSVSKQSSRILNALWSVLDAASSLQNNDLVSYIFNKDPFNPYASTAACECILDAFEAVF